MYQYQQQQQHYQQSPVNYQPHIVLPDPPKLIRPKCGARFAFGGKLIIFSKYSPFQDEPMAETFVVDVFQVVTEPVVFQKATELCRALNGDGSNLNLPVVAELCSRRAVESLEPAERCIWQCLQAHVQRNTRQTYINIVGGSDDVASLAEKVKNVCGLSLSATEDSDGVVNGSTERDVTVTSDGSHDEADDDVDTPSPWPLSSVTDESHQFELPTAAQSAGRDGLLCQLITRGKYSTAVELCILENKWVDALQLAMLGNRGLYDRTQHRYYEQLRDPVSKLICLVASDRWDLLVASAAFRNRDSWRQIFNILLNHVQSNELTQHLEQLGKRMESGPQSDDNHFWAPTCYIAAGLVDHLVDNLSKKKGGAPLTTGDLHDAIEKATILRLSLGGGSQRAVEVGPVLADRLGRYADLLVEQGCFVLALQLLDALPDEIEPHLMELRHRVYLACSGYAPTGIRRPKAPFEPARITYSQQRQPFQPTSWSRAATSIAPAQMYHSSVGAMAQAYTQQAPMASPQMYSGSVGASTQSYSQQAAPPPQASVGSSHDQPVSAVRSMRGRYPSYSSDGISYPSRAVGAAPQFPAASANSQAYPGTHQPYSNFGAATYLQQQQHQQQQPYQPPFQQPASSNSNAYNSLTPTAITSPSPVPAMPQPMLPPPPAGPATELHHRPWNDPPPLSPKKKTSATKKSEPQQPVTFPFSGGYGQPVVDQSSYQPQFQAMYHQETPVVYQQQQQQSVQHAPTPPPVVTVPAEHEIIISVLKRLAELIAANAPNVQTRRRIETRLQELDANLPPLLASAKLSKVTLEELHRLVDAIRAYDYGTAMAIHAHIVEGSEFSTIASFMPSVKVLIQSAAQMGVYYS